MSKYEIATFIVCFINGFVCYLIGYVVGITHDKRTITHECVKDTHDKTEPQRFPKNTDKPFRAVWLDDELNEIGAPQTDLLVKTPHKSRESHEKNCETCLDKDAYDEWQGNCDECENGSMYTPQTRRSE